MANRRMLSRAIVKTDSFMTMPLTAQALYMHLVMDADDEGFIASPKILLRATGASEDDLNILVTKKFVIAFASGVIVIKHWKINNHITDSRVKETTFIEEKSLLRLRTNGAYTLSDDGTPLVCRVQANCMQSANNLFASLDQSRLDKNSISQSIIDALTDEEFDSLQKQVVSDGLIELIDKLETVDAASVNKPYAYCLKVAKEIGVMKP